MPGRVERANEQDEQEKVVEERIAMMETDKTSLWPLADTRRGKGFVARVGAVDP